MSSAIAGLSTLFPYPRPDFDRSHAWLSLDGQWGFAEDPTGIGYRMNWQYPDHGDWQQEITVPFPWESRASGIGKEWLPIGWYRRAIERPAEWGEQRTILHFGAVHYHARIWIDGKFVGNHTNGYLPFSFDITDFLTDGRGQLVVCVEAPVDKRFIPHGKQRSMPTDDWNDCAFTASSGIWQSVWLEARPATYVEAIELRPSDGLDAIQARVKVSGDNASGATLEISGEGIAPLSRTVGEAGWLDVTIPVAAPRLWSPTDPHLYTFEFALASSDGVDRVGSYTGLRKIEVRGDQFWLNGERIYLRGALDQGFWPEGIHTPPDDEALRLDVELALEAGWNLIRKHIKLEHPRWLYWADKLGLLVWEEPACYGRYSPFAAREFEAQLEPMVARDGNHPCIIIWGIYNEEWGLDWATTESVERQEAVIRAYDLLKAADPSRPIVDDSGWWHVKTDIVDWHYYDMDIAGWNKVTAALASDPDAHFGHGLSSVIYLETQLSIPGVTSKGKPLMNGEYGGGTKENQGWLFRWQTMDIRRHDAFCGYIYTEFTDVQYEVVGIYDEHRQLKPLDVVPAEVNAESLLIFDITPIAPGRDVESVAGKVDFGVGLSHHGADALQGTLHYGWTRGESIGSLPLAAEPFLASGYTPVTLDAPASPQRLHLWLVDDAGSERACFYLDVGIGA